MKKNLSSETEIRAVFDTLVEPKLKWSINSLNLLKKIEIENNKLCVTVTLVTEDPTEEAAFQKQAIKALENLGWVEPSIFINPINIATEGISGIQNIIFVGSGKGGVGKSNIAVNLAAGLKQLGYTVGLMDADIYGPSIPTMLGIKERPQVLPDEYLMPIEAHGLKTMSIGYLVEDTKAIDWRGHMASGTILQFINKTFWGKLDYLIIDLPPGTGDIQLTLAHKIKCNGILLVTTPQDVALRDVCRTVELCRDRKIPILGLVENMSFFTCQECGHVHTPFESSKSALEGIETLARLPLLPEIAKSADAGIPFILKDTQSDCQKLLLNLAKEIANKLKIRSTDQKVA